MRLSTILLAASLTANGALLAVVALGTNSPSSDASAPLAPPAPAAAPAAPPAPPTWTELTGSDDLAAERDRLRAEGFPPNLVRAILAAQIRESFSAQRKALEAAQGEPPFWKLPTFDPKAQAALRALDEEQQKTLKDLLGPDPDNSAAAQLRRQFPGFSEDQIDQLAAIRDRYDEQRREIFNNARGVGGPMALTPDEQQKFNGFDKAMHAEFAAVLTPQQLEDYDLRSSNTANSMRYGLGNFELTEAEFRAVYKLRAAFDDQYNPYGGGSPSPEQMRVRMDAQKQLDQQIASALGPDRYAEYQRATDYNYRQTSQLVARLALPPETANQLYVVQKEIEGRRGNIYSNSALTPDDRTQQLKALQQDGLARVTPLLGGSAPAVEAYKQYGGSWLANLMPRPAPASGSGSGDTILIRGAIAPAPPR